MACFLVPAAEAIVVTVAAQVIKKNEQKAETLNDKKSKALEVVENVKIATSRKLMWLTYLLWGGAFLLAYEHVWHGEVTPWFPFLTAAADPADAMEMLHEMGTAGVCMALIVTAVWALAVLVINKMAKNTGAAQTAAAAK